MVLALKVWWYLPFFVKKMAKGVRNRMMTEQKESNIVSNLLPLASSDWIVANVMLIASHSKLFLNNHMTWYESVGPNSGRARFLLFHHAFCYYFLMFKDFCKKPNSLGSSMNVLRNSVHMILWEWSYTRWSSKSANTISNTSKLIQGIYTEWPAVQAQLQSRQDNLPPITTQSCCVSKMQVHKIDVVRFSKFHNDKSSKEPSDTSSCACDNFPSQHNRKVSYSANKTMGRVKWYLLNKSPHMTRSPPETRCPLLHAAS